MPFLQRLSEGLARKTSRRSLFGRGAEVAFGALAGAAAGTIAHGGAAIAGPGTVCAFPGPACHCDKCQSSGVCAKPCIILTTYYTTGCWVTAGITCCDCDCNIAGHTVCGCGSDYHNNPANCP
jgi:hypothetical protein